MLRRGWITMSKPEGMAVRGNKNAILTSHRRDKVHCLGLVLAISAWIE